MFTVADENVTSYYIYRPYIDIYKINSTSRMNFLKLKIKSDLTIEF